MRDPKRIPIAMEDIMHEWGKFPDMRLGQIISNAMSGCGVDLFYIEDDELIKRIQDHCVKGVHFDGTETNT